MPIENYQIVVGVIVTIVIFLLAGFFILALVTYYNQRKKRFILEKQNLQTIFNEQLLQSQLEMQEQTFNTISQEIHDNVGQILSLAKVQVNIMDRSETLDRRMLADVKESISKAMIDLRDIAKSLNSERIKLSSLVEMTNHELQRIERLGIIKTFFYLNGREENIQEQKKLIILRIIQESLQNILKHSKAEKIDVSFYYGSGNFKCEISDNGIGFDQNLITKKDGLGLRNIISRAALIGGEGHIDSTVNKGTTITINLPYA